MQVIDEVQPIQANTENSVKLSQYRGLTPFKAGKTGNAGGRPKTSDLRAFLLNWMELKHSGVKNKTRLVEQILKVSPAVILHYTHGKPSETVSLQNADGTNLMSQDVIQAAIAAAALRSSN